MAHEELKQRVYLANLALVEAGLVVLTWGNASGVDRSAGVMAIKPSGVPYARLTAADIIVMSIASGEIVDGEGRPSSDAPTHLHLYREFPGCHGVAHTHSTVATSFAQARRDIPCLGTTHADNFYGAIPCTREMNDAEIGTDYELNTGRVIVECFRSKRIDPAGAGRVAGGSCAFCLGRNTRKSGGKRDRARVFRADGAQHLRDQSRGSRIVAGIDRQALSPQARPGCLLRAATNQMKSSP